MKFEINHNEITLILSLTPEENYIPSDRFNRLSPQTILPLNKKEIPAFTLDIEATYKNETANFYFNSVLLSTSEDETMEELEEYITNEEILENIEEFWKHFFDKSEKPTWAK
jgi:hypothetical protein